jgi:hypothetical protein
MDVFSDSATPALSGHVTILSSCLCLGLPGGLFSSGFLTKNVYAFLYVPMRATIPDDLIILDVIILLILGEDYKLCSSSFCSFLQHSITSFLFGTNILLSALFPNTLTLCVSLNVRDEV